MTEQRDPTMATAQRPDLPPDQPANRPLSTSDLAGANQMAPTNAPGQPVAPDRPAANRPGDSRGPSSTGQTTDDQEEPLFAPDRAQGFRGRWDSIQTGFVDEPRRAVEQADTLVAEVIQQLAKSFADERSKLEGQWSRGSDISTEDLRLSLRRYRSFFDRLLTM